jgi:hypothetical protein
MIYVKYVTDFASDAMGNYNVCLVLNTLPIYFVLGDFVANVLKEKMFSILFFIAYLLPIITRYFVCPVHQCIQYLSDYVLPHPFCNECV